jgi:hypothetical protein
LKAYGESFGEGAGLTIFRGYPTLCCTLTQDLDLINPVHMNVVFQVPFRLAVLLPSLLAFVPHQLTAADTLDLWQWRNPLPSGNTRGRIAHLNGQYIVLTSGPGLLISTDGTNWTARTLPFDGSISQLAYGNGRYVVVGSEQSGGLIASSSDLVSWARYDVGTPYALSGVGFGGGTFVAVGAGSNVNAGYVVTSTTGTNWTVQATPPGPALADVLPVPYLRRRSSAWCLVAATTWA